MAPARSSPLRSTLPARPPSLKSSARLAGPADLLVYGAGSVRGQRRPLEEVTPDDFDAIVAVNLKVAFLFVKAVAPVTKGKGTGGIITISSRVGLATSLSGVPSSAGAKHGQIGPVMQIAQQLGLFGITVNSIAPGFMATSPDYEQQWNNSSPEFHENFINNTAMRRMGMPRDIADAVTFLVSDHAPDWRRDHRRRRQPAGMTKSFFAET